MRVEGQLDLKLCAASFAGLISHSFHPPPQLPFGLNKSLIYYISCKWEKQKQSAALNRNQEAQHLAACHNHTMFKMLGYKYISYRKPELKQGCISTSVSKPLYFFIQERANEA